MKSLVVVLACLAGCAHVLCEANPAGKATAAGHSDSVTACIPKNPASSTAACEKQFGAQFRATAADEAAQKCVALHGVQCGAIECTTACANTAELEGKEQGMFLSSTSPKCPGQDACIYGGNIYACGCACAPKTGPTARASCAPVTK